MEDNKETAEKLLQKAINGDTVILGISAEKMLKDVLANYYNKED